MIGFAARRFATALVTAWVASIIAFVLFWTVPNVDPAYWLGGAEKGTNETRARATEQYGLDDPLPVQYVRLMKSILKGDVECFYACGSLRQVFLEALPVTISLVARGRPDRGGTRGLARADLRAAPRGLAGPADHDGRHSRLLRSVARAGGPPVGLRLLPLGMVSHRRATSR